MNLATGKLHVPGTTDAAARMVDPLPRLGEELAALKARRYPKRVPDRTELVFPTSTGTRMGPSHVRRRILAAVELANDRLAGTDGDRIRDG